MNNAQRCTCIFIIRHLQHSGALWQFSLEYKPEGIELICTLAPGIKHEKIQLYSEAATLKLMKGKTTYFVDMFDGKKIVPKSANIFMLGKDEPTLADIQVMAKDAMY